MPRARPHAVGQCRVPWVSEDCHLGDRLASSPLAGAGFRAAPTLRVAECLRVAAWEHVPLCAPQPRGLQDASLDWDDSLAGEQQYAAELREQELRAAAPLGPIEGIVPRYRFGRDDLHVLSEGVGPHSAEVLGDGDDAAARDVPIDPFGHTRVDLDSTDPSSRQS